MRVDEDEHVDFLARARMSLIKCERELIVCKMINDSLEGIHEQKPKPSEEWNLTW